MMARYILRFLREDEAATAVEYAVLLAMILTVTIGAIQTVGGQAGGLWGGIEGDLQEHGFIQGD